MFILSLLFGERVLWSHLLCRWGGSALLICLHPCPKCWKCSNTLSCLDSAGQGEDPELGACWESSLPTESYSPSHWSFHLGLRAVIFCWKNVCFEVSFPIPMILFYDSKNSINIIVLQQDFDTLIFQGTLFWLYKQNLTFEISWLWWVVICYDAFNYKLLMRKNMANIAYMLSSKMVTAHT